jgi:hypothetical protein
MATPAMEDRIMELMPDEASAVLALGGDPPAAPVGEAADLNDELAGLGEAARTARLHRKQVRERQGVTYERRRARAVAEAAIWEAALVKNHPPDLRAGPQGPGPLPLRASWRPSRCW